MEHILVIEGDPAEAQRILHLLSQAGYTAVRTGTLHEALETLESAFVRAVLLDLALPDVDAISRLRATANDAAIVAIGDVDDEFLAAEARHAGAQEFLYKPQITQGLLDRVIKHAIARKRLEDELARARRMEILGRLATGIAHDFNNQLTAILGYAELARWNLEPGHPAGDHIAHILAAAHRSAALTNNLLAFGRKEGFDPQHADLGELMAPLGKVLARVLGEDIDLTFETGSAPAPVLVDPVQIQQIVLHLALQAREAMPRGGALEISSEVVDQSDSGHPGLAAGPHVMLTIRARVAGGAEDLSPLVEELTHENGGRIKLEIEPGVGRTTRIYFPVLAPKGKKLQPAPEARGDETVLVVEDDVHVRELVGNVLEECGYQVLRAEHAEGALDLCRTRRDIRLLLTDLVLPGRGGVELATVVGKERPRLKVLFMSGYGARVPVPAGANLLPKPLTPTSLAREVRRVLDQ